MPCFYLITIFFIFYFSGVLIFFTGMIINIHSDSILRNLRKPGEKDYKIPKGGLFNYSIVLFLFVCFVYLINLFIR